jgi:VCBS repeat-containing protein
VADITAGNLVFTPAANANGTGYASLTFSVRDSNNAYDAAPNTLTFNVIAVNDSPVLSANTGSTVTEGGTDTISSSELAVTDVDHTPAQLTYLIGTGPAHGRLELTTAPGVSATTFTQADIAANRVVYVHDGSETTSDQFTFTVNDGAGGALGATTVTLTITPVNDAPTITSNGGGATAAINIAENVSAVTIVTGADVDLPTQALTYSISGGADQALFTINVATGALSFTAPPNFEVATDANGDNVYVVQVLVTDSQGESAAQTIQVTVRDVAEGAVTPPSTTPTFPPSLIPIPPAAPTNPGPPSSGVPPSSPPTGIPPAEPVIRPTEIIVNLNDTKSPTDASRTVSGVIPDNGRRHDHDHLVKDQSAFHWKDESNPSPFTIIPVDPAPTLNPEDPDQLLSVSEILMTKLDDMTKSLEEAIGVAHEQERLVARVAALGGTVLSMGFVTWALQSSTLLASCLATLPILKSFDPLTVVRLSRRERNRRRQETDIEQRQEQDEFDGLKKFF